MTRGVLDDVEVVTVLISSTVVAAIVGAIAAYVSQRTLALRQARLTYEYEARKRLYAAIGPLRFQLLIAARDVVRRVGTHDLSHGWNMDPAAYYGRSLIYRLLRPLAISALVERQMSYADFSVDSSSIDLMRFETATYRMLTGSDPLPNYYGLDWSNESQHVFRDNLRAAANQLIVQDSDGKELVVDYSEFALKYPEPLADPSLAPLARLIKQSSESLLNQPVFWARIVGYAYACLWLLRRHGEAIGFAPSDVKVRRLLSATSDSQISQHIDEYPGHFDTVLQEGL